MALTSNSASTPYLTAEDFLLCYAPTIVADLLRPATNPNAPPPSYLAMLDVTNPAGAKLYRHMGIGAGEIESACAIAKRYLPLDLQALAGMSQLLLIKLNAARGFWSLAQTMRPLTARLEDVPYAMESNEMLGELRDGQRIFTFDETEAAGLPTVVPPNPNRLVTPNLIARCNRLFPNNPIGNANRWNTG